MPYFAPLRYIYLLLGLWGIYRHNLNGFSMRPSLLNTEKSTLSRSDLPGPSYRYFYAPTTQCFWQAVKMGHSPVRRRCSKSFVIRAEKVWSSQSQSPHVQGTQPHKHTIGSCLYQHHSPSCDRKKWGGANYGRGFLGHLAENRFWPMHRLCRFWQCSTTQNLVEF